MSFLTINETIDIGVVVIPDVEIKEAAFQLAKRVERASLGLEMRISSTHIPHIRFFRGRFSASIFPQIKKMLPSAKFLYEMAESELYFRENGEIFWRAVRNERMQALHEELYQRLHPLVEDLLREPLQDAFSPRIILARLSNPIDSAYLVAAEIRTPSLKARAKGLALAQLRADGSIERILDWAGVPLCVVHS